MGVLQTHMKWLTNDVLDVDFGCLNRKKGNKMDDINNLYNFPTLTLEQAIEEHRKMWNWIADKLEDSEYMDEIYEHSHISYIAIYQLKTIYVDKYCNEDKQLRKILDENADCFACVASIMTGDEDSCSGCPFVWGEEERCSQLNSPYMKLKLFINDTITRTKETDKQASAYAREIANLKLKEG